MARVVALDCHKLGNIAGTVVAIAVMGVVFAVQKVDWITAFMRIGWAFVIGYGATFLLVRVILRTTLYQMLQDRKSALQRMRRRHRNPRSDGAQAGEEVMEMPTGEPEPVEVQMATEE